MKKIKIVCHILDENNRIISEFYEWADSDGWKHDYYSPIITPGVFFQEELGDGFLGTINRQFSTL